MSDWRYYTWNSKFIQRSNTVRWQYYVASAWYTQDDCDIEDIRNHPGYQGIAKPQRIPNTLVLLHGVAL